MIGGDTSASPDKVVIDSIVLGSCASGKSVRRSGCQGGRCDLCDSSLGASAAGLELLQRGVRFDDTARDEANEAIRTHLLPEPRLAFGQKLGALGLAQAMMDVSDGLLQDLMHICEESGVDAAVECAAVPVADAAFTIAEAAEVAFSWALGGGEDYELLFTAAPRRETKLRQCAAKYGVAITRIGEIIARDPAQLQPQVFLLQDGRVDLPTVTGYDHFRA
ncbi:MAG: AIR synthase-related protein [Blastocatellia bacterium]